MKRVAVTGASGRTGWRLVQEALARGLAVTAVLRPGSRLPEGLEGADVVRLELSDRAALVRALRGCDALLIATGARPSLDPLGPLKVDALALRAQTDACREAVVPRVVLVSSLCSGRLLHPLNLFWLILLWKRLGERWLAESGLDWTVIRPGGLSESEQDLDQLGIVFSAADQQESQSIPRRLVARVCLDCLDTPAARGRILEITSRPAAAPDRRSLVEWLEREGGGASRAHR
jgi:uncharacterized protein YbjT (DUF2867 family)